MRIKHHIVEAHRRWRAHLQPGDLAVDATCGNGHDSRVLLSTGAQVIALDIQPQAKPPPGVEFHLRCHSQLEKILDGRRARLVVYNLGYLPGSDKSITTRLETTLVSVEAALRCADAICITCYPGHQEGAREEQALLEALPEPFEHLRFDQRATAPSLIWLESLPRPAERDSHSATLR